MMIQTPRLLLREIIREDAAALNAIECDPRVTRYLPFDPQTPSDTDAYVDKTLREQAANPRQIYDLAITLREESAGAGPAAHRTNLPTGMLVGRCGLGIQRPEHREAMIWYVLGPTHWGRGYAGEAAAAMLNFGFGTLGLHRVWADCDPRNTGSRRVAERLRMRLEGHLRENYFLKGEWCSTALYAVLENEWPRPAKEGA